MNYLHIKLDDSCSSCIKLQSYQFDPASLFYEQLSETRQKSQNSMQLFYIDSVVLVISSCLRFLLESIDFMNINNLERIILSKLVRSISN